MKANVSAKLKLVLSDPGARRTLMNHFVRGDEPHRTVIEIGGRRYVVRSSSTGHLRKSA